MTSTSGESKKALLYWYGDDGRTWYGKRYKSVDSDLVMNVCNAFSPVFVLTGEDKMILQLPSRSGDLQVAQVDSTGKVVTLPEPKRLKPGSPCGQIAVAGAAVSIKDLDEGVKPEVILLCKNNTRPDRYPEIGRYEFKAIIKTKVEENVPPEIVCPTQ